MRKAFAIDIDGVVLRGSKIIIGARESIRKLDNNKIPFIFFTNGGGTSEKDKATYLSKKLNINIREDQILLSHTPYRSLVESFKEEKVLILGKKNCFSVAKEYGFNNIIDSKSIFLSDPRVLPNRDANRYMKDNRMEYIHDNNVKAAMIFHDPVDWTLEIQLLCDILAPIQSSENQLRQPIPFYSCNADIMYTADYHLPRFTQGAFVTALKHLYKIVHDQDLNVTSFGKPFKVQYQFAERMLLQQSERLGLPPPLIYYGVGDNPLSDIKGANQAGPMWKSVLVRTGIFNSVDKNDNLNPADYVLDNLEQSIKFILDQ
jgi:HAD superfamily hydrolase (TIGR01456 family)